MHQNKPTAPITYLNRKGEVIHLDMYNSYPHILELALLQTLANRSLINCNCNLDKHVMKGIVDKINKILWEWGERIR